MKRKGLSRLLLVALVLVTIALVFRIVDDDWEPSVVASLSRLDAGQLKVTAFTVEEEPTELLISATGSLQSDTLLAAYPWILRSSDREVVWKLDPTPESRDKGMVVTVEDRIVLEPDEYEVYFASFGDSEQPTAEPTGFIDKVLAAFNDDFEQWRNESPKWQVIIKAATESDKARLHPADANDWKPEDRLVVWASGPMEAWSVSEFLFEADRPVNLSIRCIGAVGDENATGGWIENVETGEHVWDLATAETVHAGGAKRNRLCQQRLRLPRGRFRAIYQSEKSHAYNHWKANPPYDPMSWGMTISAVTDDDFYAISAFDPFETLPRIVALTRVRDDALLSHTFKIEEPLRVLVFAVGEGYTSSNEMFDYAWLVDEKRRKEIWKMKAEKTKHAGGASKNRRAEVVLDLDPGLYTIHYKSDGSHSYEDWNDDPPLSPQHWGVTVFALDPNYVPSADFVIPDVPPPPPSVPAVGGVPLVQLTRLGDYESVSQSFTLEEESRIQIFALGEMTRDGRYDYGWITNASTHEIVWEMTRTESTKAGGTSKNRKVDTVITLPPGEYEAHYQTDDSHAYPKFKYGGAPDNPEAWGITIWLLVETAPTPPAEPAVPSPPSPSN